VKRGTFQRAVLPKQGLAVDRANAPAAEDDQDSFQLLGQIEYSVNRMVSTQVRFCNPHPFAPGTFQP
jgi:hypothetical protein